jgi:very-short-patch-repair endonuclease
MRTNTTNFARELRGADNATERALWSVLKGRSLGNYRFTRQFAVGPYFADFACRSKMLVIELDGSQHHAAAAYDARRDAYFLACGYSVLRLPSGSVLRNLSGICDLVLAILDGRMETSVEAHDMKFLRSDMPAVRRGFSSRSARRTGSAEES